jgi:hypothetical protein
MLVQYVRSGVQRVLSPGVKRLGSEADHPPPSSAEVKNAWSCTSNPSCVFIGWYLVKHRDNLILNFYPQFLEAVSSIPNLRTRHAMVTGTHLKRAGIIIVK